MDIDRPVARRALRRIAPAGALVGCLGLLMASVSVAATTPSTAPVRSLTVPAKLDYSKDPSARLHRLNDAFVAESLGAGALAPGAAGPLPPLSSLPAAVAPSVGPGVRPTNVVTTPLYSCVHGHQTEDPLSPPCVASFSGDNGGSTWRGVSGNEVRLLVYLYQSGRRFSDSGTYADLDAPPSSGEDPQLTALRRLEAYFNRHYQTYGRRVHFFAYFADPTGLGAPDETSLEEADENRLLVDPFVSVRAEQAQVPNPLPPNATDLYQEALARRGVMSFDLNGSRPDALGRSYPGLVWSYRPSTEQMAALFASYVCQKVVGKPVALTGDPGQKGTARHLALVHATGQGAQRYDLLSDLVRAKVEQCGGHIDADVAYPLTGKSCDVYGSGYAPGSGPQFSVDPARLRARGITTVLWPGCQLSSAIASWTERGGGHPEWILLGTGTIDNNTAAATTGLEPWDHRAILITPKAFVPPVSQAICARALAESGTDRDTVVEAAGCLSYPLLRQVFSFIQQAGPRLTPAAIAAAARADDGPDPSPPDAPPCRYQRDDFTCLKDAQAELWDGTVVDPSGEPPFLYPNTVSGGNGRAAVGCWRSIDGGRRSLPGRWPPGNIDAQLTGHEPCNDPDQIGG